MSGGPYMQGRNIVAVFLVSMVLLGASGTWRGGIAADARGPAAGENLSPGEAAALLRETGSGGDFLLLDVRTPQEYRDGHIAGAVLIDYTAPSFREELAGLERGKTYLVYCRTGNRSGKAASLMKELQFRNVRHLAGGITKWKEEGFPTVR
jgi:rhodanese-related sulfurtransferase